MTTMIYKLCVLIIAAMFLVSCALPRPPQYAQQDEQAQMAADLARQGLDYFAKGRFFEAERSFRLAMLHSSVTPRLEFNLAISLERQGSLDEAEAILTSLTKRAAREPLYWAALARVAAAQGAIPHALGAYDKAIQYASSLTDEEFDVRGMLIAKSALAGSVGMIEKAVCASDEAYQRAPGAGELDRHIQTLMRLGRFQQAFERSSEALRTKEVSTPSPTLVKALVFYFIETNRCADATRWLERTARTGVPDGTTALDFDLALMICGKAPVFFGDTPTAESVQRALSEQRNGRTIFGPSWPPKILLFAIDQSSRYSS